MKSLFHHGEGTEQKEAETHLDHKDDGGVRRPDHDLQVEEFLKEQYKSKAGRGLPSVADEIQ